MDVPYGLSKDYYITIHLAARLSEIRRENPEINDFHMCYALLNYCVSISNGSELHHQFLRDALEGCIWRGDESE